MRLATWGMAVGLLAAPATAQRVQVANGAIEGTHVSTAATPVDAYLGIPYAAAPIGPLRWQPPRPAAQWTGVRKADRFGSRCMQQPLYADMKFRSAGISEDCLTLNVWTPAGAKPGARLPVLFYIHGGGAIAGDGSELRYDGAAMAQKGIVVVTINYRLGAFGFLATNALAAESPTHSSGNYGLLDQAAALAWVRRNAAAFGAIPRGSRSAARVRVLCRSAC